MSLLYPPWPPPVVSQKIKLASNTLLFRSPLSGITQFGTRSTGHYEFEVQTELLDDTRLASWLAFLENSQESAQPFLWNAYPKAVPVNYPGGYAGGAAWGTPLVNGANQTGSSLIADGFLAGAAFKAGDCLSFSNGTYMEMHRLTANATANGSGQATLAINPPIRRSPADNAAILFDGHNTTTSLRMGCEVILADGQQAAWQMQGFQMNSSFRLIEVPR